MTNITFYNGLREIGGTFIAIETEVSCLMFDFGFAASGRMDNKIKNRLEHYPEDCVRLGLLPQIDGVYNKKVADRLGVLPYGEAQKKCYFIISHMHIDHMGGLGMLDPDIPVYMSEESKILYGLLEEQKDIEYRAHPNCIGVPFKEQIVMGDILVTILPVDHDIVGASGFLIETPDGKIAYTGDYRFHGFNSDYSYEFAERAKGADVLITEGVTVSFGDVNLLEADRPEEERTELTLQEEMYEYAKNEKKLLVINSYNRNIERIHALIHTLKKAGRTLVLDTLHASYVSGFYPNDEISVYQETMDDKEVSKDWKIITKTELLTNSSDYVLQLDYSNMYELLDLASVISLYIHMDGSPLGGYDPSFEIMINLLNSLAIPYKNKGLGGHAAPFYLRYMIDTIAPDILVPIHSFRPEQVISEKIKKQFLPQYGDCIKLQKALLQK